MASKRALSRRESEVMDVLFRLGEGTAEDVLAELDDPPTNSAIRSTLRILVDKGRLKHAAARRGRSYVYRPAVSPRQAQRSALRSVVDTFFAGSTSRAAASLLEDAAAKLEPEELDELQRLIERAKKEGR